MDDDDKFWTSTRHWKHFDADQSLARVNPTTGEIEVLRGGPSPWWPVGDRNWHPLTDPARRAAMGITSDDKGFYLQGAGRDHFGILIDRIEELRNQTDPAKGDASAVGKDLAAFQALETAGQLVEALVGWAIAHQTGLAAEGLSFVPLGPGGTYRELPEYSSARAAVDSHRHEITGDQLIRGQTDAIDPATARQAAINLLHANPGAIPPRVADGLRDALLALGMNDVRPILAPAASGRKATFVEEQLQLEAICFAQFRAATGLISLAQAQREVAEAFGVSFDTLKGWEPRLRTTLGQLTVSRAIGFAKNTGSQVKASASKIGAINARPEMTGHTRYGDAAVSSAVERYKHRKD